ncbi:hypothetical protein COV16_06385 [Candidatus Woesearchaeota archaeon CG10_big_fil_rev_8_21_14_0_10_34_8]|nr:MAG: hypothetical protein COV16_06385 [Candidatus Woesearchaeota archaeon CG10_big_fil_rev_8_21_14_0_10_34_8]
MRLIWIIMVVFLCTACTSKIDRDFERLVKTMEYRRLIEKDNKIVLLEDFESGMKSYMEIASGNGGKLTADISDDSPVFGNALKLDYRKKLVTTKNTYAYVYFYGKYNFTNFSAMQFTIKTQGKGGVMDIQLMETDNDTWVWHKKNFLVMRGTFESVLKFDDFEIASWSEGDRVFDRSNIKGLVITFNPSPILPSQTILIDNVMLLREY